MKRIFSYNLVILISTFLLLVFIDVTSFLLIKAGTYVNWNTIEGYLIIVINLLLVGLALFYFRMGNRFSKGMEGEKEVNNILNTLPSDYSHLSDFADGKKGNIDFIVVGKTGVWSIEVKNYIQREIIMNKYLEKDLKQAYAESKELERFINQSLKISVPVTPVLVFANKKTKIHFGMVPQNGVYVIGASWLIELLTKHSSGYLTPEQCFAIKEKLKLNTSRIN